MTDRIASPPEYENPHGRHGTDHDGHPNRGGPDDRDRDQGLATPDGAMMPTERLVASLEAWRASEVLDGAGEPRTAAANGPVSEVEQLRREVPQLHQAMASRAVIEQAKGALILRYGLGAEAAFAVLVRLSQTSNVKVRTIADALVNAICVGDHSRVYDPGLVRWLEECLRTHGPVSDGLVDPRSGRAPLTAKGCGP